MKIQKQIDVRLLKKFQSNSVRLVQYDTGIQLVFNVLDFVLPSNTTATLYVRKKSGKFVYQETGVTVSGNTVTVDLENQAVTEPGETFYQLRFKNGADVISTFSSSMWVERSLADADAVESTTVIAAFEAKTAEQIAEIEAAAREQIEVIQNLYSTYSTKNDSANAVKGKLSGAVVFADDVSPVDHNPIVWVHGKNLFNSELLNGVFLSDSFNLDAENGLVFKSIKAHLRPGTYTVSFGKEVNIVRSIIDGEYEIVGYVGVTKHTFTVTTDGNVGFTFRDSASITTEWNNSVAIQIETGETATDHESYIDPTTVKVKRFSKNLIDSELMKSSVTLNGVTITRKKDQIVLNGTLTVDSVLYNTHFCYHAGLGNYYTLSYKYMGGAVTGSASVCVGDSETAESARQSWANIKMQNADNSFTYQMTKPFVKDLWFYAMAGVVFDNYRIMIQFEPGKGATDFESCNGAEYTPAENGTVSGIISHSPNMTILTDTAGVIVECVYNRDTNKVVEKSGGTVSDEQIASAVKEYFTKNPVSGGSVERESEINLLAVNWIGDSSPYSQEVSIPGVTRNSRITLTPSVQQLTIFYEKDITFVTENDDGVVTVYVIGQKPQNDYTIQASIVEVIR